MAKSAVELTRMERSSWGDRRRVAASRWLPPFLGLAVLVAAVAVPTMRAARLADPVATTAFSVPYPPASAIASLDAIAAVPVGARPRSPVPAAGMVFVRCTSLWTSQPDGSEHRLFDMADLSSPTFSPDARTIAFLAHGPAGQELWMVGADGSDPTRIGTLASGGAPIAATAGALAWSPDGTSLAFAFRTPLDDPWGSAIWMLRLGSGRFLQAGLGWPAPFWIGRHLFAAVLDSGGEPAFRALNARSNREGRELSSGTGDVAASLSPGWWTSVWEKDTAIVRLVGGNPLIAVRARYFKRDQLVAEPPPGYRIALSAPPAVLQDGPVAVTLVGPGGGPDLGLLDPETGRWTIMDYAWDPAWSPAPAALGPVDARRAVQVARDLLGAWNHPERTSLLLDGHRYGALAPLSHMGFTLGAPVRTRIGWSVPATVFGRSEAGYRYRRLALTVRAEGGRLVAHPLATSPFRPIGTIEQAVAFLESTLSAKVLPPAGLPPGTGLARDPVSAWTWGNRTTGQLNLVVATGLAHRPNRRMTISYGGAGFGCVTPHPVDVAGTPGLATSNQVAWPAGPKDWNAPYGIWGDLPKVTIMSVARAMETARLSG